MSPFEKYSMPPRRRGPRWILLLLPLAVVVGLHMFRMAVRGPMNGAETAVLESPVPAPPTMEQTPGPAGPAAEEMSEAFLADVYPSEHLAAAALSSRMADAIAGVNSTPDDVRLFLPSGFPEAAMIRQAAMQAFPNAQVFEANAEDGTAPGGGSVDVKLRIAAVPVQHSQPGGSRGKIELTAMGTGKTRTLSTKFIDRPWAGDATAYMNERPDHLWIIGHSGKPALTEVEARRAAEEDAVRRIVPLMERPPSAGRLRISAPLPLRIPGIPGRVTSPQALPLLQAIRSRLPVSDRFVQQYKRSYGTVWSESVLVDVSPGWLAAIDREQATLATRTEVRTKTALGSALVVLLSILVTYLFLNGVTKSYFTGRLRTAAIVVAIGVVIVMMGVISHP